MDYYAILDVAPEATQDTIFHAYQKAQQTYSLDNPEIFKVFSPDEAQAWVELIEEAYQVIGSPNARRQYDIENGLPKNGLPSLELENSANTTPSKAAETTLAEGYGQTKYSQYQLSPAMEEAIEKQEQFDGLFLKKVREYKKIDLKAFSTLTCIAIRHLYAIENNNFSVLPAAVFVRGYIIQYCRVLELDESKVVSSFMALLKNGH